MSYTKGLSPMSSILVLRITNVYVLPDDREKDNFCIRHVGQDKMKEDIVLKRYDRSREVWGECLHLFLEHLWKLKKDMKNRKSSKKDRSQSSASETESPSESVQHSRNTRKHYSRRHQDEDD